MDCKPGIMLAMISEVCVFESEAVDVEEIDTMRLLPSESILLSQEN